MLSLSAWGEHGTTARRLGSVSAHLPLTLAEFVEGKTSLLGEVSISAERLRFTLRYVDAVDLAAANDVVCARVVSCILFQARK